MPLPAMHLREFFRVNRLRQLSYAPLLAAAMTLMMVRLLLMARILDVPQFGSFSGGMLVASSFCMLGCLGLLGILQREWPVDLLRGQERRGLVMSAQCMLVAFYCALAGIVFAAAGFSVAGIEPLVFAAGIVNGVAQQVFLVASVESRSRGDSMRYAWENAARAGGSLLVGVGAALLWRSAVAVLLVEGAVSLAMTWAMFRKSAGFAQNTPRYFFVLASRRLGKVNWATALTLMAAATVAFLSGNVDRWVASDHLDAHGFAAYSFAWIAILIAQGMQAVFNASLYPSLARNCAAHGRSYAFRIAAVSSLALLLLGLLCVVPIDLALDLGIRRWFPVYAPALELVPIFLAVAVLRVSEFWSSYLLIVGSEKALLYLNVIMTLSCVAAWIVFVQPMGRVLQPRDVAQLAILLAAVGYLSTGVMAWVKRK